MTQEEIYKKIEDVAQQIGEKFHPEKIILFGSYAWGEPGPDSDVDLFIVKETDNTRQMAREIDGFIFPRPFPIDIIVYRPEQTEKSQKKDFFIRDIIGKGRILYGQNNSDKNHLDWFKKADEDELSIIAILKNGGAFSTACFLSQQMAEKYLKGLLVFFDRPFPKIHDLLDLETALLPDLPKIQDLHPYLKELNRYYTETRYPGDYPEFTLRAAQDAHQAAIRIKDFILGVVNKK